MTLRSRELVHLIVASLIVITGFATVFIAKSKVLDAASLTYGVFIVLLFVLAHIAVRAWTPFADPYLLPLTAVLCGLGVTMLYRLDTAIARRQTMWLVVGVALLIALLSQLKDHRMLERYKYIVGGGGVLALLITVSPLGTSIRGSQLWLKIGPMQIQPGEFAKIAIVVFLAAYLRENREMLQRGFSPKHLGPLMLFWGASMALLVLMNDFGTSLLFFGTFLLMVYVATARWWYLAAGFGSFAAGATFVYKSANHVQQRFDIWLNPWQDPEDTGYQLIRGLFAMADGGLFGRGLGQAYLVMSPGKYVIPDAHTDFIYAAVGDDLGWVGAVALLMVYVVVAWRGFSIAQRCQDGFSKLLAFGLSTIFTLQTVIIVGGVVRLLPLTGQTLPFVSYGGSSVLANFLLIGILLVVSHRTNVQLAGGRATAIGERAR